jgi:hypothetical protein
MPNTLIRWPARVDYPELRHRLDQFFDEFSGGETPPSWPSWRSSRTATRASRARRHFRPRWTQARSRPAATTASSRSPCHCQRLGRIRWSRSRPRRPSRVSLPGRRSTRARHAVLNGRLARRLAMLMSACGPSPPSALPGCSLRCVAYVRQQHVRMSEWRRPTMVRLRSNAQGRGRWLNRLRRSTSSATRIIVA